MTTFTALCFAVAVPAAIFLVATLLAAVGEDVVTSA